MLRRATAGPEMASIHKMMGGDMNMDKGGGMPMNGGDKAASPQQALHVAVHVASGDVFDLLDAMTQQPGLSCADLQPVSRRRDAAPTA
jgi:hypothetical protein